MNREMPKGREADLSRWRDDFYWRRVVGAKKPETEADILQALQDQGIEDEEEVALILEEILREEEEQTSVWTSPVISTSEGRKQFNRGGGFH